MADRLTKAKALAALEAGCDFVFSLPDAYEVYQGERWLLTANHPLTGLAAAADALGLSPDPDVMGEGLTLTEEELEALRWAAAYCADIAEKIPILTYQQRAEAFRSLLTRLQQKGGAS